MLVGLGHMSKAGAAGTMGAERNVVALCAFVLMAESDKPTFSYLEHPQAGVRF